MDLSLSGLLVLSPFGQQMAPCGFFSCRQLCLLYLIPSLPPLPPPHTHTWQVCVTRKDAVTSLEVTSCLTRGTEGREKTGLHCFRLRRSCLVFSANTSARDTIPLDADPTFYHDVRLTFASMLLPFAVLGNSVLVILPFLFNMKIFFKEQHSIGE